MEQKQFTIQLRIGSQTFPINIEREKEAMYRNAEKMINRKLQQYASQFPNQTNETYMSMTLLDMGLILSQENNFDDRLKKIVDILNSTM